MKATQRRAIFLDRDGVLIATSVRNGKPYAITDGEPAVALGGAAEACAALKTAGYLLVLVTNQPDVGRGSTSRGFVERTNAALMQTLGLDAVRACCHCPEEECACRKPRPGMLIEAAERLAIDLDASVMVGDRWSDIEAGRNAGCATVLIERGYGERAAESPDHIANDLLAAVPWILALSPEHKGHSS